MLNADTAVDVAKDRNIVEQMIVFLMAPSFPGRLKQDAVAVKIKECFLPACKNPHVHRFCRVDAHTLKRRVIGRREK